MAAVCVCVCIISDYLGMYELEIRIWHFKQDTHCLIHHFFLYSFLDVKLERWSTKLSGTRISKNIHYRYTNVNVCRCYINMALRSVYNAKVYGI